jgi:hypothetical protein
MKYFDRIRILQDYLSKQAEERYICRINNTNIDRTLVIIQRILFSVLQRRQSCLNEDHLTSSVKMLTIIQEEFTKAMEGISGSKEMSQWIQRRIEKQNHVSDIIKEMMTAEAWMPSVDEDMLSIEESHSMITFNVERV